jgi:uncharacterized RDD family membrane protein YckC
MDEVSPTYATNSENVELPPVESVETRTTPSLLETVIDTAPAPSLPLEASSAERPVRIIKESEAGANYLDELTAICEQNLAIEHSPARYLQRITAALIDLFAIALASTPYWVISYFHGVNLKDQRVLILLGAATLVIALVYLIMFTYLAAGTLGMMVVGTRVINGHTGTPPSFLQCLMRAFGYLLCVATAGLGFIWMFLDREQRGLHDLCSATLVKEDY